MIKLLAGAAFAAFALVAGAAVAQAPPAAPAAPPPQAPMAIKEVKPGLYMVTGNGGNTTVRIGKDGLIVVDTKNPGDAIYAELMKTIAGVSALPVKDVIITHLHADHSGNIVSFESMGIPVIAQSEEMMLNEKAAPGPGGRKPLDPSIVYSSELVIKIDGATAVAHHYTPAHTGGDALVLFPDLKVLSGGDEIVAATPNIDYHNDGSALGWLKSMDAVAKLDFDTVIPGHGDNPLTRAQFDAYRQKWITFVQRAQAAAKANPKDKFLAAIKTDDLGWNLTTAQWTAPARLDPFYAEMSK